MRKAAMDTDYFNKGVASGYSELAAIEAAVKSKKLAVLPLETEMYDFYKALLPRLGRGESSCITSAYHRNAVAATDDRAVRYACREHKIPVTGTIGILKSEIVSGTLTLENAENALALMVKAGFYSPVKRLQDII